MAERPAPYFHANPGDVIHSGEWNELQVKAREEIRSHRHTGSEDGSLIPRAGIETGAIDGRLIDPAAEVSVRTLTASGNLTVNGDLSVNGKALLGDIADLLATVKGLQDDKLNRRGDTVGGTLQVQRNLLVGGNVGIGTEAPTHRFHVVAENAVGLFESSGEMAYLRLSTKEGLDNRVEFANRPGGRLALWNNGQDVFNITRNGNVGIGTTTPSQKLIVQADANTGRDPDSGLLYGGQLAIKGNAPQLDFIDTNHSDWAIRVDGNKMYFIREPWIYYNLVLDANGNVGIGTDNPPQQLTITGGLGFANQGAQDKKLYSPKDGLLEWMTHDAAGEHGFTVSHQGQVRVYLNTNGNSYLNGGNVGIGTTTPSRNLQIGPDVDGLGLEIPHTSPNSGVFRFGDNTGWKLHFGRSREIPGGVLNSGLSGVLMTIKDNGNVGIGTTEPVAALHVEGSIRLAGRLTPTTDCLRIYGFVSAWQVYFSAYVATNDQSGSLEPLPMTVTSNNVGGCYDVATSRFTAPVDGVYLFTMSGMRVDAGGGLLYWYLKVNDSGANSGGTSTAEPSERCLLTWAPVANLVASRTIIFPLKSGDKVYVKQDGAGRCDNFRSGLEGILLCATS